MIVNNQLRSPICLDHMVTVTVWYWTWTVIFKRGELRCVTPRNFFRGRDALGNTIHVLKARTHAPRISGRIGIPSYFGHVATCLVRFWQYFAFWREWLRLATFFIARVNCNFWGASFELIKNLATLNPEKLKGFHWTPLYHCYTLIIDVTNKAICERLVLFPGPHRLAIFVTIPYMPTLPSLTIKLFLDFLSPVNVCIVKVTSIKTQKISSTIQISRIVDRCEQYLK